MEGSSVRAGWAGPDASAAPCRRCSSRRTSGRRGTGSTRRRFRGDRRAVPVVPHLDTPGRRHRVGRPGPVPADPDPPLRVHRTGLWPAVDARNRRGLTMTDLPMFETVRANAYALLGDAED